jgi:CRISPR-associated protein Cmr2
MNSTLLKLQIGPVQDFIAQARSTRDLWSGSYVLSWLMTCALHKLADLMGGTEPVRTAVIYPSLQNQPLFDFLAEGAASRISRPECLTPNLANLFGARLSMDAAQAAKLAKDIKAACSQDHRDQDVHAHRLG